MMDEHQDTETTSINQLTDEPMEQTNDMTALPLFEWKNATYTNLHQLNEYCLLEIFSMMSLDPIDLCSISQTCKLFRQIIQRIVLNNKLIIKVERNSRKYDVKFRMSVRGTRNDIKRIFKIFGTRLSTVEISGDDGKEIFLLNMITQHCTDDNLKSLTINAIKISDIFTFKLKPIFKQLQELHLKFVTVPYDATIFAELNSLVELNVEYVDNYSVIFENSFPKLERLKYAERRGSLDPLTYFITRHKKIKVLHVYVMNTSDDDWSMNFRQAIGHSCKELEDLYLHNIRGPFNSLQALKSLTTLKLCFVVVEDLGLLSSLTKLRDLTLSQCTLSDDSDQFSWCYQLTKLEISMCSSSTINVIGIISRLANLKVFKIIDNFILDEITFFKIVTIVKRRPNVLTLKCHINFIANSCEKNPKVKLIPILP